MNLHIRGRAGTTLLTWEADRVLSYRVVTLKDGDNPLGWSVDNGQFPNFTLTATRMWQDQFDEAKLDVQVERDLRVTVKPVRPTVGPGESVELEVTTLDQLGRPVPAELSIAMIDQSLLRLFNDRLPDIGSFFYNQTRTGAFSTQATNTFRYEPNTIPVPQAIVDDAERGAAMAANAATRADVSRQADVQTIVGTQGGDRKMLSPNIAVPSPGQQGQNQSGQGSQGQSREGERLPATLQAGEVAAAPAPMTGKEVSLGRRSSDQGRGEEEAKVPARLGYSEDRDLEYPRNFADISEDRIALTGRFLKGGQSQSRERFVESAYWNPSVVTGKDGKARVTFKAPPALSEYRITARGVTGSDTLAGQTTASLTVRKKFFVNLRVPSSLTQGDKPRFIAQVHHTDVRGTLSLRLATYAGGRDDVFPKTLEIKGDGVDEVVFDPYEVPEGDSVRLTLTGTVGEVKDELVIEVPIRPWGVPVYRVGLGHE